MRLACTPKQLLHTMLSAGRRGIKGQHLSTRLPSSVPSSRFLRRFLILLCIMGAGYGYDYECGGFIDLTKAVTGTLTSPSYPGAYPTYARCIWILEAGQKFTVQLTITFTGETYSGSCSDYIQIYDGGTSGTKLVDECGTLTSSVVTSTGRWMYIYFKSDGITGSGTGLSATYTSVYTGVDSNITDPAETCRSYEFTCGNKVCLSMSYRCDGYNDCGCGEDCDEDGCRGLPLSGLAQKLIGVAVGVAVFVVVAFLGLVLEKHHNWEHQRSGSINSTSRPQHGRYHRSGWGTPRDKNSSNMVALKPSPVVSPRSNIQSTGEGRTLGLTP